MNIVFMGTPDFAVDSLRKLISKGHNISAVVTVPDKPKGRGLQTTPGAIKKFASGSGMKILQPAKLNEPDFIEELKKLKPELIVVVAFRILPESVYTLPKYGSVNLHASLLPKYRGAAPINWAIINGEKETGVTTFFLQKKVDTGNIILQKKCAINNDDDAGTLHDKLASLGAEAIEETVEMIEKYGIETQVLSQDDASASAAPKIFKEDCRINWNLPVKKVYDFVRGLSPYPGAFTTFEGKILKVYKTRIINDKRLDAGVLLISENSVYAGCLDGVLEIIELQPEAKRKMSAGDFARGLRKTGEFRLL